MQIKSIDNYLIYYDVTGAGPVIILLHGFGNDSSMWSNAGWLDRLKNRYTIVTFDLRGCGRSEISMNRDFYSIDNQFNDIDLIIEKLGSRKPVLWGWSLGATIALLYAKYRDISATIAGGTYFGKIFSDSFVNKNLENNNDVNKIRLSSFADWPTVNPDEIGNPYLIYTGTKDGNVVVQLKKQADEIHKSKGEFVIFNGLDHFGLINEIDIVEPVLINFLERVF